MKNINPFSSDPAMADWYIEYQGDIDNSSGSLSDGTSVLMPITTDIRHCLMVQTWCEQAAGGTFRKFNAEYSTSGGINNTFIVTIEVPSECICYYKISGYICKDVPVHEEQGTGTGNSDPQHAGGHKHDGNDSKKISYANITGTPTIPTVLPFINDAVFNFNGSPATYGYDTNYGADGVNFTSISGMTLKIVEITYNTNDGIGNYNVGTNSLVATIGGDTVAVADRFSFRFFDNAGTDTIAIYRNGTLYKNLTTIIPGMPQPASGNSTYKLIVRYA